MALVIIFALSFLVFGKVIGELKHVYPGTIFSTLAWVTTSQAFAFYVNNFGNYSRIYGSIGGIIVFMIWFYISSVVVLLGGEINATLYNTFYKSSYDNSSQ